MVMTHAPCSRAPHRRRTRCVLQTRWTRATSGSFADITDQHACTVELANCLAESHSLVAVETDELETARVKAQCAAIKQAATKLWSTPAKLVKCMAAEPGPSEWPNADIGAIGHSEGGPAVLRDWTGTWTQAVVPHWTEKLWTAATIAPHDCGPKKPEPGSAKQPCPRKLRPVAFGGGADLNLTESCMISATNRPTPSCSGLEFAVTKLDTKAPRCNGLTRNGPQDDMTLVGSAAALNQPWNDIERTLAEAAIDSEAADVACGRLGLSSTPDREPPPEIRNLCAWWPRCKDAWKMGSDRRCLRYLRGCR